MNRWPWLLLATLLSCSGRAETSPDKDLSDATTPEVGVDAAPLPDLGSTPDFSTVEDVGPDLDMCGGDEIGCLDNAIQRLNGCGTPVELIEQCLAPASCFEANCIVRAPDADFRREELLLGSAPAVTARYRSYDGAVPSWVTPPAGSSITHDLAVDVVSTPRAAGFHAFWATRFDGDCHLLASTGELDPAVGGTLAAWALPDEPDGVVASNGVLAVALVGGHWVARAGSIVLTAPDAVVLGEWHEVAVQVAKLGADVRARLYVDQKLVAEQQTPGTLTTPTAPIALGCEPVGDTIGAVNLAENTDHFTGRIHAAYATNFPVDHDFLVTKLLRDGGRNLGRASFHDYLSATPSLPLRQQTTDRKYPDLAKARTRFEYSMTNDDFVAQGLGIEPSGQHLYLAAYHNALSGGAWVTSEQTIVSKVDVTTEELVAIYKLRTANGGTYTAHGGGVAVVGDVLYLADSESGSSVQRFVLSSAQREAGNVFTLRSAADQATAASSFLDYDPQTKTMWVGTFDDAALARVYEYAMNGEALGSSPLRSFQLPVTRVQGLVRAGGPDTAPHFLLVRSYGSAPSEIHYWDSATTTTTRVARLPQGFEDADIGPDGTLWTWSESGAKYYQKRSNADSGKTPWEDYAPWIVGFDTAVLTP